MKNSQYDVLVVGAGIIGSACAFRLAEAGFKAAVLEAADAPATGSTGRSAAGVRVQFSSPGNVQLSWHSIQEYARFHDDFGVDIDYRKIGYLLLVPEADWQKHLLSVELQRQLGAPVEVLDVTAATNLVPFSTDGIRGATYGPSDGVVDPHCVTFGYLGLAKDQGANVFLGTEFLKASRRGQSWLVSTSGGTFEAPWIVNAAGPWARLVAQRAGLTVPVDPVRRIVFMSGPLERHHDLPLTIDLGTGFYLRSEGQRLLFGRSNLEETPGFKEGIDWNWLEPTLHAGLSRFPWLESVSLDRRASWWGYYETTPDHGPILGKMYGTDGWVNACGFSGHGVQQAPAVGKVITEEIVDGEARSISIDEFRIERFKDGVQSAERNIV